MAAEVVGDIGKLAEGLIDEISLRLKNRPGIDPEKLRKVLLTHVIIQRGMETKVEVFDPRTRDNEIYFLTQATSNLKEVFLTTFSAQHARVGDPRQSLKAQIYKMLGKAGFKGIESEESKEAQGNSGGSAGQYPTSRDTTPRFY